MSIQAVELIKAYRLLNIGATTLISAKHDGMENVMAAAWVGALDYQPPKVTAVIDKIAYTRPLIEKSGYFAIQIPVAAQAELVLAMGESRHDRPDKLANVPLFYPPGFDIPLVQGCAAWLVCRLINEPHNQQAHDLFIGEVVAAWADERIFKHGHWQFDNAPDEWRTLHYVAGGQFYTIGEGFNLKQGPNVGD